MEIAVDVPYFLQKKKEEKKRKEKTPSSAGYSLQHVPVILAAEIILLEINHRLVQNYQREKTDLTAKAGADSLASAWRLFSDLYSHWCKSIDHPHILVSRAVRTLSWLYQQNEHYKQCFDICEFFRERRSAEGGWEIMSCFPPKSTLRRQRNWQRNSRRIESTSAEWKPTLAPPTL